MTAKALSPKIEMLLLLLYLGCIKDSTALWISITEEDEERAKSESGFITISKILFEKNGGKYEAEAYLMLMYNKQKVFSFKVIIKIFFMLFLCKKQECQHWLYCVVTKSSQVSLKVRSNVCLFIYGVYTRATRTRATCGSFSLLLWLPVENK